MLEYWNNGMVGEKGLYAPYSTIPWILFCDFYYQKTSIHSSYKQVDGSARLDLADRFIKIFHRSDGLVIDLFDNVLDL
jgi:hypothetical protein